jgi:hypothetical protein
MSALASLAEVPALPLHTAGKYVAAAYIVLFVLVLVYVSIMALRLSRIERNLGELLELSERAAQQPASSEQQAPAVPAQQTATPQQGPAAPEQGLAERESTLA